MAGASPDGARVLAFLLPVAGAAVLWLTYPVLTSIPPRGFGSVVLGLASAAVVAGAWAGARVAARPEHHPVQVAAGLGAGSLAFLGLMAFFVPSGPTGGGPSTIRAGSFFFLPLALGYAAAAAGLATPRLEGPRRWGLLAACTAVGPLAFLLADRGADFGDIFHGTIDFRILLHLPGLLPLATGLAALAVPAEGAPRGASWFVGGLLAAAGFLAPWLWMLPWGLGVVLYEGNLAFLLRTAPGLLPLALLAAAAFLVRGTRRGVLAVAVVATAMPVWMGQCMRVCDFPT